MKSSTQHNFAVAPMVEHPRSVFNRSCTHKTAFDSGLLIPIFLDEVLPGDTFNLRATFFARLQTLKFPIMDNLYLDCQWFFCPNRLLWEHWQQFMGERDTIAEILTPTEYLTPVLGDGITPFNRKWIAPESLEDYLGLPVTTDGRMLDISALPCRMYYKIWNAWYRDQNLQDPLTEDISDGPDVTGYALQKRNKRPDYFTSALPWQQKGPQVLMPLGSSAAVFGNGHVLGLTDGTSNFGLRNYGGDLNASVQELYALDGHVPATAGTTPAAAMDLGVLTKSGAGSHPEYTGLYADLSTATASTINVIREAFQLQRLLERDARGGTRYIEMIKSHFGVTSPDFRLQRPELLGSSSVRINVHPVQQTSSSPSTGETSSNVKGSLAAYALATSSNGFSKSFVEHGWVMGIVSVRADLTYQSGTNRMFSRRTRLDYYLPVLANLPEQEILNQEIWADASGTDQGVWGYQERWAEYRYKPSLITGKFRSAVGAGLDVWHLAQDFDTLPGLNSDFMEENPPVSRVVMVTSEPEIIFDSYFEYKCARVMPTYSVPGLIDHL